MALAERFAAIALGHVTRPYPHKADHVWTGDADNGTPREQHPIWFGSFDWHSCVHGHWLLARLLREYPDMAQAAAIRALFDDSYTQAKVDAELAYLARPSAGGFERPYGWAWLLRLAAELARHDGPWGEAIAPLGRAFADRFKIFLPKATYPLRGGVHTNTAFALTLALDWDDEALAELIRATAAGWYAADADAPAWEPSGDEFLSPTLVEAQLMRRVLPAEDFAVWFDRFLPRCAERRPATLFVPATVSDRSDGKIAHLDGLNLSRAWCWRGIAHSLPAGHAAVAVALAAADDHFASALAHVAGDYMGEHWLASFALLALID